MVFETTNGSDALQLAKQQHPDLLISNLLLPDMRGPELIDRMKLIYRDLKVMLIADNYLGTLPIDFIESANKILQQPLSEAVLLSQVIAVLSI